MIHPSTPLLVLLECIKQAGSLETYFYFPHLILAGSNQIERTDFEYLIEQAYLKEQGADAFGKQYALTFKAEQILSDSIYPMSKEGIVFALN